MTLHKHTFDAFLAKAGNRLIGTPHAAKAWEIQSIGRGNTLLIGKGVKFAGGMVKFNGSNATLKIGDDCVIDSRLVISGSSKMEIGSRTKIVNGGRLHAAAEHTVRIGADCLLEEVGIRTCDSHSILDLSTNQRINPSADVTIEDGVWLAESVRVYKGVTIGKGTAVGPRSTVTRSLPGGVFALGSPAVAVAENIGWKEELI